MSKKRYVYDPLMLLHEGHDQVENPDRILYIYNKLMNPKDILIK